MIALSNVNKDIIEKYSYNAFGGVTIRDSLNAVRSNSAYGNCYMFTGRQYDSETGLYYYRARYYSPTIGRFLQADPIGYYDSMNLYQYCGNNPLNWIDPFGLWHWQEHEALTRGAMTGGGFSRGQLTRAANSNTNTDRLTNFFNNPDHYMPGTRDRAEQRIKDHLDRAVDRWLHGDKDGAMDELGRGLHTLQDKWAHDKQSAGLKEHVDGTDPDNPTLHHDEFENARRESNDYVNEFRRRVGL